MADTSLTIVQMFAEIVVGVSRRLQTILAHDVNERGYFYHSFQGPFDEACYVLWELDVARADPGNGGLGIPWVRKQVDDPIDAAAFSFFSATETRARITSQAFPLQAMIDRLLEAFLGVACDYGPVGSTLSISREPFRPQAEYDREIAALAAFGYVECSGEFIKWTEKVAAAMQAQHFWDSSGAVPLPRLIPLSIDAQQQVKSLLQQDKRLAAIAAIRTNTDATISEAMQYLEELDHLGPAAPIFG